MYPQDCPAFELRLDLPTSFDTVIRKGEHVVGMGKLDHPGLRMLVVLCWSEQHGWLTFHLWRHEVRPLTRAAREQLDLVRYG